MKQAIYEHLYDLENTNIAIHYYTNRGSYFPPTGTRPLS